MNTEQTFKCACCTHALHVDHDEHGDWNFAVWEWYPYGGKLSWRQRLSYIWQVVRWGKPYGEHVSLGRADASHLARVLLELPEGGVVWSAADTGAATWTWMPTYHSGTGTAA